MIDKSGWSEYSTAPAFIERENKTVEDIRETCKKFSKIGVSVSGGKDSTVMLHLLLRECKDKLIVMYFDGDSAYPDTLDFFDNIMRDWDVDVYFVKLIYSHATLYKMMGWLGHEPADGVYYKFAGKRPTRYFTIKEPSARMIKLYNLDLQCIGLRKEESPIRHKLLCKGKLQYVKYDGVHHYFPLADWKGRDIWAYMFKHNIPYNTLYDKLHFKQGNPEIQRVCGYLTEGNHTYRGFAFLRKFYPNIYNELLIDFPGIRTIV